MQFSQEEIKKAYSIATLEMQKRIEHYKPNKPVIKDNAGWICKAIYQGNTGGELAFSFTLQWNYSVAGSIGRIHQIVHTRLLVSSSQSGRVLRLKSIHVPEWVENRCPLCTGFNEQIVMLEDTSLYEY